MYSLNCPYYSKSFSTVEELINDLLLSGMDTDYFITRDGKVMKEKAIDLIIF